MSELLIRHGEWVVVCDGAKALVLENAGDAKFPNLKTIEVFEQKDLADPRARHRRAGPRLQFGGHGAQRGRADRLARSGRAGISSCIWRSTSTAPLPPARPSR